MGFPTPAKRAKRANSRETNTCNLRAVFATVRPRKTTKSTDNYEKSLPAPAAGLGDHRWNGPGPTRARRHQQMEHQQTRGEQAATRRHCQRSYLRQGHQADLSGVVLPLPRRYAAK